MPETLDIEKIKRKLKPSYADYGKALIATLLTAPEKRLCTREELDKISFRSANNNTKLNTAPRELYKPIHSDFLTGNETARLNQKIAYNTVRLLSSSLASIGLVDENSRERLNQEIPNSGNKLRDKQNKLIQKAEKSTAETADFIYFDKLRFNLNEISNSFIYSFLYLKAWNTFIYLLINELGLQPATTSFIYDIDDITEALNTTVIHIMDGLEKYPTIKKGMLSEKSRQEILSSRSSLTETLKQLQSFELHDSSLKIITGIISSILKEPYTTYSDPLTILLSAIAFTEFELFQAPQQEILE